MAKKATAQLHKIEIDSRYVLIIKSQLVPALEDLEALSDRIEGWWKGEEKVLIVHVPPDIEVSLERIEVEEHGMSNGAGSRSANKDSQD